VPVSDCRLLIDRKYRWKNPGWDLCFRGRDRGFLSLGLWSGKTWGHSRWNRRSHKHRSVISLN